MRVVILGGTGFVGQAIATGLSGSHRVVAVGLPGPRPAGLHRLEVLHADVLVDDEPVTAALAGADAVVYAVAPRGRRDRTGPRMVEAAARASRAAARAGVRRWVQLSNVSVYRSGDAWVSDDAPASPDTPLGEATVRTEEVVTRQLGAAGVGLTFLRLGPVYARDARLSGVSLSYVDPGTNWLSFVGRDDVTTAVSLALAGVLPPVCVVADGAPVRAVDAATLAARYRGATVHRVPDRTARRFGVDAYALLTLSVRIRPAALTAAGWRPSTLLSVVTGPGETERATLRQAGR